MIVNCEGCESGFHVDERLLKPGGSKVRCSKCRHVFVVYPPPPPMDDSEEPLVLSQEMAAEGAGAVDANMASIAAKLNEIFDDAPTPSPAPAAEEPEMLDVADLLAEDAAEPADTAADKGELDFDLDLGPAAGTAAAGSAVQSPAVGAPAEEEIDFNLDLAPAGKSPESAGDLPDLDELELDLSALEAAVDNAPPAPGAGAEPEGGAGHELELNLDFEVPGRESAAAGVAAAAEAAGHDAAGPSSEELSLDLINELNLDLDSAPEATTTTLSKNAKKENPLAKTDQIDLADLENLLDDLEPAAAAEPAEAELDLDVRPEPAAAEAQDIDLSFLNDAGDEIPVPPAALAAAAAPEPAAAAAPREAESSDELDFSDLSNILEGEQPQEKKAEDIQDIQLVLDDAAPAAEAVAVSQEPMLDIEALLSDDAGTAAARPETEGAPQKKPVATTDLEIEFEPVEEARGAGRPAKATTAFGTAVVVEADDVSTQDSRLAGGREATDVLGNEPAEKPAPAPVKKPAAAVPRRSGGGILKPLMAMVVLVVLALAALVVPRTLGIHIPYLSDTEIPVLSEIDLELPYIGHVGKLFKAEVADPAGRLKILPDAASITAEFVDNPAAGRLLVVRGKVRNAYDHPRSAIRVTTTLFRKGGASVKSATVYAGRTLTNDELAGLDLDAIQSRLAVSASTVNREQAAKPGASLPFMAVFGNLPAAIEEYSVEVAGSKP